MLARRLSSAWPLVTVSRSRTIQANWPEMNWQASSGLTTGSQSCEEGADPIVALERLPGQEDKAPTRAQGTRDVRERGWGIAEKHRPGPANGNVEALVRKGIDLGVGLLKCHVCHVLPLRQLARKLDHARRQIHSECRPGASTPRGVSGCLPATAPDVEHVRGRVDRCCSEELAVNRRRPLRDTCM
jgi:hypothetical protein